jgi:Tol biopolymer transport system component
MGSVRARITLVAVAALLVVPASAQATFPGANGKIAFVRDNDIWTMNPDGSNQVDITNTPTAHEDAPSWSADGKQIAYARSVTTQYLGSPLSGIWVMNADGTGQHEVLPPPNDTTVCGPGASFYASNFGSPAWSPDAAKIASTTTACAGSTRSSTTTTSTP